MIQKWVQDPLAAELLSGEIGDGSTVKIGAAHGKLTINGKPVGGEEPEEAARQADGPPPVSAERAGDGLAIGRCANLPRLTSCSPHAGRRDIRRL